MAKRLFRQRTNGYGEIVLDKKHRYSLEASLRNTQVLVETYPWTVKFYDVKGTLLEQLPRIYGDEVTQSINIATSIRNVMQKPNSWRNSVLREHLDSGNPLKDYLDGVEDTATIKKTLYRFGDAMETFGYDTVLMAFQELVERKMDVTNKYNLQACCNRVETFDPKKSRNATGIDLEKYAVLMGRSDQDRRDSHAHQ